MHYIDKGIDTGDIITQKIFSISEQDNYKTLLEKAISECPVILTEALIQIKENKVKRIKQSTIDKSGSYYRCRTIGDENVSLSLSENEFINFIRAITFPGPCARVKCNNLEIALISVEKIINTSMYNGRQGEIVENSERGCVLKLKDSAVLITEICYVEGGSLTEAFKPTWQIGQMLEELDEFT